MLTSENPIDGSITIMADVPEGIDLPVTGVFSKVVVSNWAAVRKTDGRVMSDATVPALVELHMVDGFKLGIWPDGTFVVYPAGKNASESWSRKITPDGVVKNPFRD